MDKNRIKQKSDQIKIDIAQKTGLELEAVSSLLDWLGLHGALQHRLYLEAVAIESLFAKNVRRFDEVDYSVIRLSTGEIAPPLQMLRPNDQLDK